MGDLVTLELLSDTLRGIPTWKEALFAFDECIRPLPMAAANFKDCKTELHKIKMKTEKSSMLS